MQLVLIIHFCIHHHCKYVMHTQGKVMQMAAAAAVVVLPAHKVQ
jgi:hypothetical protein